MEDLKFKIRKMDCEDWDAVQESFSKYVEHLKSTKLKDTNNLLKYFGYDFFHDGEIKDIKIFNSYRTISFRIDAPNIKPKSEKELNEMGYLWSEFLCEFNNVIWFEIEGIFLDENNDSLDTRGPQKLEYLYSEIDTLTTRINHYTMQYKNSIYFDGDDPEFHSILIELVSPGGFIAMVFTDVNVLPLEPLAWSQIVQSGNYEIPLFKFNKGMGT